MSNLEVFDKLSKQLIKHDLRKIDLYMLELRNMVKDEPVYYRSLTPLEEQFPKLKELKQKRVEHRRE